MKEFRELSLKLEACMNRLDAAIRKMDAAVSEMQSEREALNHYKQLISSLFIELKRSNELTTSATANSASTTAGSGGSATSPVASVPDERFDLPSKLKDILSDFQKRQPKLVEAIQSTPTTGSVASLDQSISAATATHALQISDFDQETVKLKEQPQKHSELVTDLAAEWSFQRTYFQAELKDADSRCAALQTELSRSVQQNQMV